MTGYQSKRAMAQAKTIDEVNWADHEPDGKKAAAQEKLAQPEQEPVDDYTTSVIAARNI